jgi:hypothetical protein
MSVPHRCLALIAYNDCASLPVERKICYPRLQTLHRLFASMRLKRFSCCGTALGVVVVKHPGNIPGRLQLAMNTRTDPADQPVDRCQLGRTELPPGGSALRHSRVPAVTSDRSPGSTSALVIKLFQVFSLHRMSSYETVEVTE